jgi:hypothetical protein
MGVGMVARRLGILTVALMVGSTATAGPSELTVSGAVRIPWTGIAEWTMKIDGEGRVAGAAKGARCRLTSEERAELNRLLSALPAAEQEHHLGRGNPDLQRLFSLVIRRSDVVRSYSYWECDQEPCRDRAAIERIKRLWVFVRGLCQTTSGKTP